MTDTRVLKTAWLILLAITVGSALVAETADPAIWVVLLITFSICIKGQLVIDHLMGLRKAPALIRWLMLSYFYLLPPLIALALLFPEALRELTTL